MKENVQENVSQDKIICLLLLFLSVRHARNAYKSYDTYRLLIMYPQVITSKLYFIVLCQLSIFNETLAK